jgi:uncharacterized membrane protein
MRARYMRGMNDNVTRFPPPAPRPDWRADVRTPIHAVHGLIAAAFGIFWFLGGFWEWIGIGMAVAAAAIALSKRDETGSWMRSHYEFGLRTVVIAGAVWTLWTLIGIVPVIGWTIAWVGKVALLLWVSLRAIFGIMRAAEKRPIPNARTWLV